MEAGRHCFSHRACGVDGPGGNMRSRRQGRGGEAQGPSAPAPLWDNQVKEELGSPDLLHRPDEGEPGRGQDSDAGRAGC